MTIAALLIVVGLVAAACGGGDSTSSPFSAEELASIDGFRLELLEPGAEPLAVRQYDLDVGTVVSSTLTQESSLDQAIDGAPSAIVSTEVVQDVETTVTAAADGTFDVVTELVAVEASSRDPEIEAEVRNNVAAMIGETIDMTVDGTGRPLSFTGGLSEVASALDVGLVVPLPTDPIGIGAIWSTTSLVANDGAEIVQVSTYEVISIEGTLFTLDLTLEQFPGPDGMVPNIDLEPDEERFSAAGDGRIVFDLTRPMPEESTTELTQDLFLRFRERGRDVELTQQSTIRSSAVTEP